MQTEEKNLEEESKNESLRSGKRPRRPAGILVRSIILFAVFFIGTASILVLDDICRQTTGEGGNLVLDIDKLNLDK